MSRPGWYLDEDVEDAQWTADELEQHGFWRLVDSHSTIYGEHRGECPTTQVGWWPSVLTCGDWVHIRGGGCVAARSDRQQCARAPLKGVPFCEFHFGSAWRTMRAFVNQDREEEMGRLVEFDRERRYAEHAMDVAMVRDAQRQLAQGQERVYFFAAGTVVKIGRSIHPDKRVRSLAGTKAPDGVDVRAGELLGTIPGSHHVESELHRRFAYCRLAGEWFDLEEIRGDLEALIAQFAVDAEAAS